MGEPLTPLRVALLGCGYISAQYLRTLSAMPNLGLVAVADADAARAAAIGRAHGVRVLAGVDALGADEGVDAVVNLTPPQAHHETTATLLRAGKHVYQEKPFALDLAGAEDLVQLAEAHGVRLGVAPDTVLGTGVQTARAVVDAGELGRVVGASAHLLLPGHERWHPDPGFYYRRGGGPVLDMGVYYLSALVTILGPVSEVVSFASRSGETRTVPPGSPRAGESLPVEVDTHVAALLRHESGAITTLTMSFDVAATTLPPIQVFGSAASLQVPDPNHFEGPVSLGDATGWAEVPPRAGFRNAGRGVGLADLAASLITGRPHRAAAELALHVHAAMLALGESADAGGAPRPVPHRCDRPRAVPLCDDPTTEEDA